jgi:hypothetical protein
MSPFVEYERTVIRSLLADRFETAYANELLTAAQLVSYDHTGIGYFLTVEHEHLPMQRIVCDVPVLTGSYEGMDCGFVGFVAFIENGNLTLECYAWSGDAIPIDIRERDLRIELTAE